MNIRYIIGIGLLGVLYYPCQSMDNEMEKLRVKYLQDLVCQNKQWEDRVKAIVGSNTGSCIQQYAQLVRNEIAAVNDEQNKVQSSNKGNETDTVVSNESDKNKSVEYVPDNWEFTPKERRFMEAAEYLAKYHELMSDDDADEEENGDIYALGKSNVVTVKYNNFSIIRLLEVFGTDNHFDCVEHLSQELRKELEDKNLLRICCTWEALLKKLKNLKDVSSITYGNGNNTICIQFDHMQPFKKVAQLFLKDHADLIESIESESLKSAEDQLKRIINSCPEHGYPKHDENN